MRKYARKIILFPIFFVLLAANTVFAAFPAPIGYVNDFAGVLDRDSGARLNQILSSFEQKTGNEIAVAVVKSLDGNTIEDYAVKLYQQWGIGKKGKDNGLLILVAPSEKQVRIEAGYGLEGIINDAMAGRIIREKMIPAFKEGNYSAGILNGTLTTLNVIAKSQGIEFDPSAGVQIQNYNIDTQKEGGILRTLGSVFLFLLLAYLFIRHPWLFLLFLSGMGRGGGRGGGFGGGFGGFGGGLSGGGGATGRW
jgi:uncharacterized protein